MIRTSERLSAPTRAWAFFRDAVFREEKFEIDCELAPDALIDRIQSAIAAPFDVHSSRSVKPLRGGINGRGFYGVIRFPMFVDYLVRVKATASALETGSRLNVSVGYPTGLPIVFLIIATGPIILSMTYVLLNGLSLYAVILGLFAYLFSSLFFGAPRPTLIVRREAERIFGAICHGA